MIVKFIGHGIKGNKETVGDYICSSLKDNTYNSFTAFSAFTKMSGINAIKNELLKAKQNGKSIKFYLGIVEKGTSKEALEFMIKNSIPTWIFCTSSSIMFHPKIYYFEGEKRTRFITGSSNLTKPGLFDNIEASTLMEFNPTDNQGQKFKNQFLNYFSTILDGTDQNVEELNNEVLKDLIEAGFVFGENETRDDFNFTSKNKDLFNKRNKKTFKKEELGSLKTQKTRRSSSMYEDTVTQYYLDSWNELFNEYLEYAKKENRQTVARNYESYRLYTWYRKQKIFYSKKIIPQLHYEKLEKAGFYFGDANELKWQNIEEEWLDILLDALLDKEDIRMNHRYIYKDRKLGTWLVSIRQANKKNKKLELKKTINDLGFHFKDTSRLTKDVIERFVRDLSKSESPSKMAFRNRFNSKVSANKEKISVALQIKVEEVWKTKFNEDLKWKVASRTVDKTEEWKNFRYDKVRNPEGKWYKGKSHLGKIYEWVWAKKREKRKMNLVIDNFNKTELRELKAEGFPIE
jgi:HKD family nuclease